MPLSPALRSKRVRDYWHKHGKFIFDQPGYNPITAQVHKPTTPQSPNPTTTPTHINPPVSVIHIERPEWDEGSDYSASRTPYDMRPMVAAERRERETLRITTKDYGKRWRGAFRDMIGEMPECEPGEHNKARLYWYRIRQALEHGGWTPNEGHTLNMLEKRWRTRKDGDDPRFEVMGTHRGRPGPKERREIHDRKILVEIARLSRRERGGK